MQSRPSVTSASLPTPSEGTVDPAGSLAGAAQAMTAVSRLVAASTRVGGDAPALGETLVAEARALFAASRAVLLAYAEEGGLATHVAGDAIDDLTLSEESAIRRLLADPGGSLVLDAAQATQLTRELLGDGGSSAGGALLVTLATEGGPHVLVLTHSDPEGLPTEAVAAVEALAAAGVVALERRRDLERVARRAADHQALTRAAKTLNESLDLPTVLRRIAGEANRILDGDYTAVYRGSADGAIIEAAAGIPPELLGFALKPGEGLSGKVLTSGRPLLSNDYQSLPALPAEPFFDDVRTCLAVPMHWEGELRGVLTVGYQRPFEATEEHLGVLETFAELAAVACTNASAHAGLALAARTDGLTGCLNHAALHETLQREIERAERAPDPELSLVMMDLDDFKTINEAHGHLVGDEVLRRAGHSLRQATRPYDVAARYGGDEFVLIAVDADEEKAREIALRAIDRIADAIGDLCAGSAGRATAGVTQWQPGVSAVELLAEADRALLFGKHEEGRGRSVGVSSVPEWFRPGRFSRRLERGADATPGRPAPPTGTLPGSRSAAPRPADERLRARARGLARACALGAELTLLIDEPERLLESAVDGVADAFGAPVSAIYRHRTDGMPQCVAVTGLDSRPEFAQEIATRCERERRPVLAAGAAARARLAVPILCGDEDWGSLMVLAAKPEGLDEDDLHLATALAEHLGAALLAGERHAAALVAAVQRLSRAAAP
jgi:diguanylate cyclase (GGDEF)-like protein